MPSARARRVLNSIGANVRRLRLLRGVTQQRLAEKADLDERFLQRIEHGETNIGIESLVALADALDVEPVDFFEPAQIAPATRGRPKKTK